MTEEQAKEMNKIIKNIFIINNKDIKCIDKYMKNPVILFNHDFHTLPIGRTLKIDNNLYTICFSRQLLDERNISSEQLQNFLEKEGISFEAGIDKEGNLLEISLIPNE